VFDRLRSLFAPKAPKRREYLGAQLSRTQSFIVSLQRADMEIRKDLAALRAHSRNLAKNTPYMRRYLRVLGAATIGDKGVTLCAQARKKRGVLLDSTNEDLEAAWAEWGANPTVCGRYSWAALQRQALRTTALDGECFIRILRGVGEYGFTLQFLDADLLDHTFNTEPGKAGGAVVMGVEMDAWGKPVAYHFSDTTERGLGSWNQQSSNKRFRIPADEIIHLYDPERVNQTRGVPWAAPAMYLMSMLSAYWEAEVAAARHEAERIAFIKEELGPAGDGCSKEGPSAKAAEIQSGPVTYLGLEPGQDIVTPEVNHPNTAFAEFSKAMLKGIASALGVSYASLASDLTEVSFSSIRQGELEQRDHWREIQDLIITKLCKRVYAEWLPWAVLNGQVSIPAGLTIRDLSAATWTPRGWDWVDPKKDMEAAKLALDMKITTRTRLLAERGQDYEETLEELAREEEIAKRLGIDLAMEPAPVEQKKPGGANAA